MRGLDRGTGREWGREKERHAKAVGMECWKHNFVPAFLKKLERSSDEQF